MHGVKFFDLFRLKNCYDFSAVCVRVCVCACVCVCVCVCV